MIRLPQGAQTVASNPFCAHAAVLYPGQAYTIQPHPEFENPVVEGLVAYRGRGIVPDDLLDIATEHLGDAIDNGSVADQFERFFKTKELS